MENLLHKIRPTHTLGGGFFPAVRARLRQEAIMDALDKEILRLLQKNARTPFSEIGRILNLSVPSVSKRVSRMEKDKTITRYTTLLNPKQLNKTVTCHCFVILKNKTPDVDLRFAEFIEQESDILECHCITGDYEFLLKIVSESMAHLEALILRLRHRAPVVRTSTYIVLSSLKENPSATP